MTSMERLIVAVGAKVVSLVPWNRPRSTTYITASKYQALLDTSRKGDCTGAVPVAVVRHRPSAAQEEEEAAVTTTSVSVR